MTLENEGALVTVHIREATAEDAEALAHLATQLWYPSQPEQIVRRLASLPPTSSRVFVAVAEGNVVGLVQVSVYSPFLMDDAAEIAALVVDEEWRGRGIGHALVKAAETWALENGCSTIYVRTNIIRERSGGFYRQIGFQQVKTAHTFAKPLASEK